MTKMLRKKFSLFFYKELQRKPRSYEYWNCSQFTEQTGHYEFIRDEENSSNSKWENHLDHVSLKILECGINGIR